jgi:hypothetical protein
MHILTIIGVVYLAITEQHVAEQQTQNGVHVLLIVLLARKGLLRG